MALRNTTTAVTTVNTAINTPGPPSTTPLMTTLISSPEKPPYSHSSKATGGLPNTCPFPHLDGGFLLAGERLRCVGTAEIDRGSVEKLHREVEVARVRSRIQHHFLLFCDTRTMHRRDGTEVGVGVWGL